MELAKTWTASYNQARIYHKLEPTMEHEIIKYEPKVCLECDKVPKRAGMHILWK